MNHLIAPLATGLALLLTSAIARAEEKAVAPVEATFAYVTNLPSTVGAKDPNTPMLEFVFDVKSDCALFSRLEISNPKLSVAGKELEVMHWSGLVYDGSFEYDPMMTPPPAPPSKWSIIVSAVGNFGKVDPASCEFSADIEMMCGKSPKEVVATLPLPKGMGTADTPATHMEVKEEESFSIRMVRKEYKIPGKPEGESIGYYLVVMPGEKKIDLGDAVMRSTFEEAFIADGKEYPRCYFKEQATDPVKVVVRYWSESYKVPVRLSKAATDKGRVPPSKGLIDGMRREGRSGE